MVLEIKLCHKKPVDCNNRVNMQSVSKLQIRLIKSQYNCSLM